MEIQRRPETHFYDHNTRDEIFTVHCLSVLTAQYLQIHYTYDSHHVLTAADLAVTSSLSVRF